MYKWLKKILFCLPPELAHSVSLKALNVAYLIGLSRFFKKSNICPVEVMGLYFPHQIGLAAGLDKNADYINGLSTLGFSFIEIGTVTPKAQSGNPKPRLFRLTKHDAIINRMGFNNKGADYVVSQLKKSKYRGLLGINIGKNKDTPNERAVDDYLYCFRKLWSFASYITINISSPNTKGLRDLQHAKALNELLSAMKSEQQAIYRQHQRYIPLVVKISPDLADEALDEMAEILLQQKMDGVIATNTTVKRETVKDSKYANEVGGLSGKPLQAQSTQLVRELYKRLEDKIPIIASGGIMSKEAMKEKLEAGAKLVQVYTGFIYEGPEIINALSTR